MLPLLFLAVAVSSCPASGAAALRTEYLSDVFAQRVVSFSQGWGQLGIDTCAHAPGKQPNPLRLRQQTYSKGLGHHAPGEIVVDLGGQYVEFLATVGVQWQQGDTGTVVFQVYVDGRKRFDSGVLHERDKPRQVRVSLRGAQELRLTATDAGDGITCDCADWAEARLIRDLTVPLPRSEDYFDAAPFARVVTFDPARTDGARATRVQPFPAGDLFLATDAPLGHDGTYRVPFSPAGQGCLGLQWDEHRLLREAGVRFAAAEAPDPRGARLQVWVGESRWQGHWETNPTVIERHGPEWRVAVKPKSAEAIRRAGTLKLRWIFPASSQPIHVRRLIARTWSRYRTAALVLETDAPRPDKRATVTVYNGEFVGHAEAEGQRWRRPWPLSGRNSIRVRYTFPASLKTEATVLRFKFPSGGVAVRVTDVLKRKRVYVPAFGLSVAAAPASCSLAEYKRRLRDRKTLLERVRERPDQTLTHALKTVHREVQNNGPVMLSLAADNRKFVVTRDGLFGPFGGGMRKRFQFHVAATAGTEPVPWRGRHLEGGWLPAPVVEARDQGVHYRWRSFVAPMDQPDDAVRSPWRHAGAVLVARFELENTTRGVAAAQLRLSVGLDDRELAGAKLIPTAGGARLEHDGKALLLADTSAAAPLLTRVAGSSLTLSGKLPAGTTAVCRVLIPRPGPAVAPAQSLLRHSLTLADVGRYWKGVLSSAMQVETPEPLLNDIIRASQVHCLMAARNEADGARLAPWIASDRYGPLESEGQSVIGGLDLFGHHDFARRSLDFYLRRYHRDGFLTTGYTLMGTGWNLWTLAQHYRLTRDDAWLKAHASTIVQACRWIVQQCDKTKRRDVFGRRVPEYGFFPPGVVADWGLFSYRFFLEGQFYAGLHDAAEALADAGIPEADELLSAAASFRRDLLRGYAWAQERQPALSLSNGTFIPGVPAMLFCHGNVGDFYPGADFNRSWAGDSEIGSHHLVPLGVVAATSRQAAWMAESLEDHWFLLSGMGEYPEKKNRADWFDLGGFAKIQPYYARLIEIHALRDDVKPFLRSYFNALASLINLETLTFWEHFHNQGAWNKTHETGGFLRQTRMLFVREHGDELWLAPFVTNNWLKQGMKVVVRNAPTQFGPVSYRLESDAAQDVIHATIDPPRRTPPAALILRVRHPSGKRMTRVIVDGRPYHQFNAATETIRLRGSTDPIHVEVHY